MAIIRLCNVAAEGVQVGPLETKADRGKPLYLVSSLAFSRNREPERSHTTHACCESADWLPEARLNLLLLTLVEHEQLSDDDHRNVSK